MKSLMVAQDIRKIEVSVLKGPINLDEEGRNMHQKMNHNLKYQMDTQEKNEALGKTRSL